MQSIVGFRQMEGLGGSMVGNGSVTARASNIFTVYVVKYTDARNTRYGILEMNSFVSGCVVCSWNPVRKLDVRKLLPQW